MIAFVSDTQEPMWIEKLWLKGDNNKEATSLIFSSLLREPDLSALFHLGDITPIGAFKCEWKQPEKYFSILKKHSIPVYPAMGNHEYFIFPSLGRDLFFREFPDIKSSWYYKTAGNIAVIILNSNLSNLSDKEKTEQQKWYENTIHQLDQTPEIKSIIVGTHHSPFTNSIIVSPSAEVQKYFVPVFLKSKKGKLFISGHSHSLEHFQKGGKDFLVIGGGGGLLHPLLIGKEQHFKDLFTDLTKRRMFHYLVCEEQNDSLQIKVKMINRDYKTFDQVYKINILESK